MLQFVLAFALQANQAAIVGTVKDASTGEPLKAAAVTLIDINHSVITDQSGAYTLIDVPAGPQHVSVYLVGYGSRTLHALVPATGKLVINVLLQAEPIPLRPVAARARVAMRGSDASQYVTHPERAASAAEVRNHPLLAEPDVFQALGGGEVVIMPESPSGIHIRGGASDQTAFVLDGVPILNPYHAAGLYSAWNPDALSQVRTSSATPSPWLPNALGGVVLGMSRAPGPQLAAQGSFSTIQSRAMMDGPVGRHGGFALSLRSSYPGLIAPRDEGTYLMGESGDVFAKLEGRALNGVARVLGYDSENEVETAAVANTPGSTTRGNVFKWHSRSLGASWLRTTARTSLDVQLWSAATDAQARWTFDSTSAATVRSERQDAGALATFEYHTRSAITSTGLRVVHSKTAYDVALETDLPTLRSLHTSTPVVTGFLSQSRDLSNRLAATFSGSIASAAGKLHPGVQAQLRWAAAQRLALTGSVARLHQYSQSLRNAESLVGNVFPVDLHVGAGDRSVPVARSDQVVVSAALQPGPGMHVAVQAYQRRSRGLVLIAARDSQPFATAEIASGSGSSRGAALDVSFSASRFGLIGSYGWQRTRLKHADGSYVPEYAAAHNLETGVIVFPSATMSVRVGAVAAFGRRASLAIGAIEWEACNLLDRGCEFAGSPRSSPAVLGASRLPAYLRMDVGARKHWHIDIARRDAAVALFGTFTNVLGRKNILGHAFDPATNQTTHVEMRPPSPLVVGIDWRF